MIVDRIKFWWNKSFAYNRQTGGGMKVQSYNPFTDVVTVRHSQFGYVTGISTKNRKDFLAQISDPGWEVDPE
jgi:hypothetical protein